MDMNEFATMHMNNVQDGLTTTVEGSTLATASGKGVASASALSSAGICALARVVTLEELGSLHSWENCRLRGITTGSEAVRDAPGSGDGNWTV